MHFISHRVNTVEELRKVRSQDGVEIDIRSYGESLILAHDPYVDGENFEDWLKEYNHGTLILNVKCERIELRVLEVLKKYSVSNYFFLDSTIPMINLLVQKYSERKVAIRFSEFEPIEVLAPFQGLVDWVWVDCFTKLELTKEIEEKIHEMGFKICLVSPELQGRDAEIEKYRDYLKSNNITLDAVCSKGYNRNRWLEFGI